MTIALALCIDHLSILSTEQRDRGQQCTKRHLEGHNKPSGDGFSTVVLFKVDGWDGNLRAGISNVSTEQLTVLIMISVAMKPNVTKQNSDKGVCVILFIPELN